MRYVEEVMSTDVDAVPSTTTLAEAAQHMQMYDCGFLPIGDDPKGKLLGVITDRDIVIRGLAQGKDANSTQVKDILSEKVLYCFKDDSLEACAKSMKDQQVSRLIVLDSPESKRMCGVVSIGDISCCDDENSIELSGETLHCIKKAA